MKLASTLRRHLVQAQLTAPFQDLLQGRDHGLAAVQAEALGSGVLLVQEAFEGLRRGQTLQDRALARLGEVGLIVNRLDAFLDPGLLVRLLDVHEFDPDGAAIGLAHNLEDLPQGRSFQAQHVVDEDRPVQILGLEAVGRGIELRMGLDGLEAERVQVGLQVAAHPVGPDHHQRPDRIQSGRADVLCGDVPVADHAGGHGLGTAAVSGQVRTTARPAVEAGQQGPGLVVQIGEKAAPERIDRLGIVLKGHCWLA
jgi:hypothetical protein